MGAWLYMLLCSDGSYYTGITRTEVETRVAQHEAGTFDGYTARRRPVKLVFDWLCDLFSEKNRWFRHEFKLEDLPPTKEALNRLSP